MKAGRYNLRYSTLKWMCALNGGMRWVAFAVNRRWQMENVPKMLKQVDCNDAARDVAGELIRTSFIARVLDALCKENETLNN